MQEAECAYVIILMAVYWCTEVLPLAITALFPALLFPLFGIMQSKDVSEITAVKRFTVQLLLVMHSVLLCVYDILPCCSRCACST